MGARKYFDILFFFAVLGSGSIKSNAELVFVPDPVSSTASTFFNATYNPSNLYDAQPTIADVDSNFDAGNVQQYAGVGAGPHVLVFDYGTPVTFSGMAYSQRLGGDPILDKVQNIDVWATDTDPGPATLELPAGLGAPQGNTGQLNTDAGLTTFAHFDLGVELSGRYVIFRFNDAGGNVGNPGGSELQLTFETGPADPDLQAARELDFGRIPAGSPAQQGQLEISNTGATQTLTISGVTLEGTDSTSFSVVSFPTSLAPGAIGELVIQFSPGAGAGMVSAVAVIASDDENNPDTAVPLKATVTGSLPDGLVLLADPTAVSASTFFSEAYAPEFLYDADPTLDDFENPAFDPLGQYAGAGAGPHAPVFDFGERIDFDGVAYAQRLGGIVDADKVPTIEFWVTDTDPGPAVLDLPILTDPAGAMTELVTTDTSALLRYYPLGTVLIGRYVIMRLGMGTFNPGGSELQLTLAGAPEELRILSFTYSGETGAIFTWNSKLGDTYKIERSTDMLGEWEELDDSYAGEDGTTNYTDNMVPAGSPRVFYRVIEN